VSGRKRRVPGLRREEVAALAGLTMITYTAEPGSASQNNLSLLASRADGLGSADAR
jgi:hypothetical protein